MSMSTNTKTRIVLSEQAPAPIGPYSQAVACNGFLFCSGQIPLDPATGKLVEGDVEAQTKQVMTNIKAVLTAAKLDFNAIVKTTIYLIDMADFPKVNGIYGAAFTQNPPARSTVAVAALPLGSRVEIEVLAALSE
jgi:2-iminobutanoate/2-iminopropanoate deaminase